MTASAHGHPRWIPTASARTRVAMAMLLWVVVGLGLGSAGLWWCRDASGPFLVWGLLAAAAVGSLKGRYVLSRVATRNAARIEDRGDGRCVFGFLSWAGWAIVPTMMGVGVLLRHSPIPRPVLGLVYVALGTAMLVGASTLARRLLGNRWPPPVA